ncbi:MAG: hypothetical protein Q7J31_19480 [Syntrophales bacterium]|nr:hypothetical protein [Syntrophales bacterium]
MTKFIAVNILVGIFFLIFGVLFLFFPQQLIKLSEWGNKVVLTNEKALSYRVTIGVFLIIGSAVIFLSSFLW